MKTIFAIGAIVIHVPAWLTSSAVAVKSPPRTDRRWLTVALTAWLALQSLVIAYARAVSPVMSRYADLYAIAFRSISSACCFF